MVLEARKGERYEQQKDKVFQAKGNRKYKHPSLLGDSNPYLTPKVLNND